MDYVKAVRRLLLAAPTDSINRLLKTGKFDKIEVKQDAGTRNYEIKLKYCPTISLAKSESLANIPSFK